MCMARSAWHAPFARPHLTARLILGGGWVNTELRSLRDPRVFDYFDYVTLDDGERPLLNLLGLSEWRPAFARADLCSRAAVKSCSKTM